MLSRSGRGLCRRCWNDKTIRAKYPPVAPFGGKEASDEWKRHRRLADQHKGKK